jgi:hypothetical protein
MKQSKIIDTTETYHPVVPYLHGILSACVCGLISVLELDTTAGRTHLYVVLIFPWCHLMGDQRYLASLAVRGSKMHDQGCSKPTFKLALVELRFIGVGSWMVGATRTHSL